MTRKDYVKFAEMLATLNPEDFSDAEEMRQEVAKRTADIFEEDNPNFDRGRFYQASNL